MYDRILSTLGDENMNTYCYQRNILLTRKKLLKEMDFSVFGEANFSNQHAIKLLEALGIHLNNLDPIDSRITFRIINPQKELGISYISSGYYDENNRLFSEFTGSLANGTLLSIEGEIYESLQMDLETTFQFLKQHHYAQHIYPETRSCIHFKGVEYNRFELASYEQMVYHMKDRIPTNKEQQILAAMHEKTKETKEIYITKDEQKFQFYYNGPHIFNNRCSSSNLSKEEVGIIQNRIEQLLFLNGNGNMKLDFAHPKKDRNDNEQFLEYIYAYLGQYRSGLERNGKNQDTYTDVLQAIKDCVWGLYPKGLYCEVIVTSQTPITTIEEKNNQFVKL